MNLKNNCLDNLPKIYSETSHFYYASLNYIEILYLTDLELISSYLESTNLEPVLFNGRGCVSINFHNYAAHFSDGIGMTSEMEVSLICIPKAYKNIAPIITIEEFLENEEQSNLVGYYRVQVPCDDDIAIKAGIDKFGEPKFKTNFKINVPSYNNQQSRRWSVDCINIETNNSIFSFEIDLSNYHSNKNYISPRTYYGYKNGNLLGSKWSAFQPINTYRVGVASREIVNYNFQDKESELVKCIESLTKGQTIKAIREIISEPCAVQGRPYWIK
ncbi:hypothetical protein [Alkalihalophilus marmarensis]|uniref:hypothetical protein n=1 Tax=Alkalihalophilus marmarensis TaxID=521377 RepID=UPI002DBF96E4|nr:hypothetical protein [Alkalihalophilus marmarensis]MEC2074271.1 hypothetical protein [Alkalihalophilus marmarensis]